MNEKSNYHCIYFDQKSAFDRVDHKLLLSKMYALGVHDQTVKWCKDYLTNRSMRVKVDNDFSSPVPVKSGVPQGGCASPLLYAIFILDISRYLPTNVKYLEYADDLKIYRDVNSPEAHRSMQSAVDGVARWCEENGMLLSTSKCVVLKNGNEEYEYYINNMTLPSCDITRDLGVQMTANLDFCHHITQLCKSASVTVNSIFRCFVIKEPDVYIRLYKSIVLSKLLYCSPVWFPHLKKHKKLLENVQSLFLRRLRWRCGSQTCDVDLPSIEALMVRQDDRILCTLKNADLFSHFFDVQPNHLRSQCTITTKCIARSEHLNNVFAWRTIKRSHHDS